MAAGEAFRVACNQCHVLPDPKRHTAEDWRAVVARMQENMDWMNRVVGSKPVPGEPALRVVDMRQADSHFGSYLCSIIKSSLELAERHTVHERPFAAQQALDVDVGTRLLREAHVVEALQRRQLPSAVSDPLWLGRRSSRSRPPVAASGWVASSQA